MRKFKFKGLTLKSHRWIYGDLMTEQGKNKKLAFIEDSETGDYIQVDSETVGQFSGLTCPDGDIYEGDIIECEGTQITVIFEAGAFGYKYPSDSKSFYPFAVNPNWEFWEFSHDKKFKIVGNVHDSAINTP